MCAAYRIASPFLIRLAGVPFDSLAQLTTATASQAARELLAQADRVSKLKPAAEQFVTRRNNGLAPEEFCAWRKAVRHGEAPEQEKVPAPLREYAAAARALKLAYLQLDSALESGVNNARRELSDTTARILPAYLLFSSGQLRHLMDLAVCGEKLPPRNSRTRERERHLLLYLQRIAAKNDTFGAFGPSAWGHTAHHATLLHLTAHPGIAARQTFLERWTAHALATVLNADAAIFSELRPRLNPVGRLTSNRFTFSDTGEAIELTSDQLAILAWCNGENSIRAICGDSLAPEQFSDDPAASIGGLAKLDQRTNFPLRAPFASVPDAVGVVTDSGGSAGAIEIIRALVARRILIAAIEVPAMEPLAFEILRRDMLNWSEGAARVRWLAVVTTISKLASDFAAAIDSKQREKILDETRQQLFALGARRKMGERALYAAVNPIAEECSREVRFEISEALLEEVVNDAEPWIDFWRDNYAFVAARVAANLRALLEKAPTKNGTISMPAFVRFCESAKLPLTGAGLVGMAHIAFQEVKAVFRERLRPHAESPEYELTAEDCAVVRRNFDYPRFDEFTYPSADLQLAAESVDAVNRGRYRWIIGELHPAAATLHHCMFWSCPDQSALSRALESMINDKPVCHFGFFAADFTAHTTIRVFDALPSQSVFVSPQRANPHWRYIAPAEVEIFVDDEADVALRCEGKYVGSFARNWIIPLGFHPFLFTIAPHTPRLRCGRVIVQRRAWSVMAEELGSGHFSGLSRDLVLAIERLRAAKDWPRFVYIRPSEQALRRSGAENRDKDTKPVFVDLESYLFLEIFHRWLTKAGELEVTEMLPAPDQLLWREPDGRRTFELRTLICPKQ